MSAIHLKNLYNFFPVKNSLLPKVTGNKSYDNQLWINIRLRKLVEKVIYLDKAQIAGTEGRNHLTVSDRHRQLDLFLKSSQYLNRNQYRVRVREHLVSDRASHIFKHLQNSEHCRALCSVDCFHILDHASTSFQLKIKEAFHIQREQPSLNQQLHHVNLKLSF